MKQIPPAVAKVARAIGGLAFTFTIPIVFGLYLDSYLHTGPLWTRVGLSVGIGGGILILIGSIITLLKKGL